jgi:hypothetical protein
MNIQQTQKIIIAILVVVVVCLATCTHQGSSPFNGTKCIDGTKYWLSDANIATLLVGSDNKPVHCN